MKKYAIYIVIFLSLIACIYAYCKLLLPLDVFIWDESHHGFFGAQIYNDLMNMNISSFWAHTNNQALWMPLHSWLDGAFLVVFGFSYASARLSSLFLFFVCAIILYLIGSELSKENGWIIGLIATALYLTSPALLHLATVNMQEMLGILVCLITVYIMVHDRPNDNEWKMVIIGFMLGIAYWAKQNYAAILILGVGLYQLSLLWDISKKDVEIQPRNAAITPPKKNKKVVQKESHYDLYVKFRANKLFNWLTDGIYILLGFLPLFILWWVTPPFQRKYALAVTFRQGVVSSPGSSMIIQFFGTAAFYLQSIFTSYNLSFWAGLGCVISIVASLFYYKDKKIRIISLIFLVNLIFISIMTLAQERYISTAAPLVFVLLAYFIVMIYERFKIIKTAAVIMYLLIAFVAASYIYDMILLTSYTKETANRSLQYFIYKERLNKYSPPFLFGLAKRPQSTYPRDFTKDKYRDFKQQPISSLNEVLNYFRENIEKDRSIGTLISLAELSPYVIYWHFHEWKAPVLTVNDIAFSSQYFWLSDYFIDIRVSPDSPYYPDIYEKQWDKVAPILLKAGAVKLVNSREFSDLGLTAKIYRREGFIR